MPVVETGIIVAALILGLVIGALLQRPTIVVLRALVKEAERRSEFHQAKLIEALRGNQRPSNGSIRMDTEPAADDSPGEAGGGDRDKQIAWANQKVAEANHRNRSPDELKLQAALSKHRTEHGNAFGGN